MCQARSSNEKYSKEERSETQGKVRDRAEDRGQRRLQQLIKPLKLWMSYNFTFQKLSIISGNKECMGLF